MEDLWNKVIEALKMRLGEGYSIIPTSKKENNGLILHGICIRRKGESVCPIIYTEGFIQDCGMGNFSPEEIADDILETYNQDAQDIIFPDAAGYLKNFLMMKEKIRIKLINYAANIGELEKIPHRRFLDLAVTYYVDMESFITGYQASVIITNELMKKWEIAEDDLYMIGMEKLLSEDGGSISNMSDMLRRLIQAEPDILTKDAVDEIKKDRNGPEMYVASNRKRRFGANCLLNVPLLQNLAEKVGYDLVIFPSSIHDLVIIPWKNENGYCLSTEDVQEINVTQVCREEWLSNSIYRYDRNKKEVSVYKEGAPLLW